MLDLNRPQVWFTYGLQTTEDNVIRQLLQNGATGVRLTFSFGTPETQAERAQQVRRLASELSQQVFLIADLQGEKCRLSEIEGIGKIPVKEHHPILLTKNHSDLNETPKRISVQLPAFLDDLEVGDIIIEGDGALSMKVIETRSEGVLCLPESDGVLRPTRGITAQKSSFRPTPITSKDEADLSAVIKSGLYDAVAISFVGDAQDIIRVKRLMSAQGRMLPTIAKIETQLGVLNCDSIASEADVLMAGRGDLALTMPWVQLYEAVSSISSAAKNAGVPWILATQLVEGLERFVFPTRAEICDLAHWLVDGACGAMLSYETAFGPRPVDAVRAVKSIVDRYYGGHSIG